MQMLNVQNSAMDVHEANGLEPFGDLESVETMETMEMITEIESRDPLEEGYQSYVMGADGQVVFSPSNDEDLGRSSRFVIPSFPSSSFPFFLHVLSFMSVSSWFYLAIFMSCIWMEWMRTQGT